jgi:lipoate---protein ligase
MSWKVIDTGINDAKENMRIDAELLHRAEAYAQPILHFYDWERPSITHGYFVRPEAFLDLHVVRSLGIDLARRPTGGGIVFHLWDFAFSAMVPRSCPQFSLNTLENYAFINRAVQKTVQKFLGESTLLEFVRNERRALDAACMHFCMAKPTKFDVVWQEKKIAGAAQRKTKQGFLHQGTISLLFPDMEVLKSVLLPGTEVLRAMQTHTYALLANRASASEIERAKKLFKQELAMHLH